MGNDELDVIVQKARQKDYPSLEKLLIWFSKEESFFRLAYRILRNYEDAKDAIQDSAIKICSTIDRSPAIDNFKSWCNTIVCHAAIDVQRQRRRHPTDSLDSEEIASALPVLNQEHEIESEEVLGIIYEAVDHGKLSTRQKAVWRLHIAGFKNPEIAGMVFGNTNSTKKVELDKNKAKGKIMDYIIDHYPDFTSIYTELDDSDSTPAVKAKLDAVENS